MRLVLGIGAALGLVAYVITAQRALRAAQLRGDMYRDIAARLDRRVVDLIEGAGSHG